MKASELFKKGIFYMARYTKTSEGYWEITLFIRELHRVTRFIVKKIPYSSEDIVHDEAIE